IVEPSKVMPSSSATSSSAGVISTDFRKPSTSVNHRRTKRTPRSSTVRSTYSSWRSTSASLGSRCPGFARRPSPLHRAFTTEQRTRNAPAEHCFGPGRTAPSRPRGLRPTRGRSEDTVVYKAEYIWIDGTEPTARLRSKTKILADGADLPIWGFDGSSTNQAPGSNSDCVLKPVFSCPDPLRGDDDKLVLCEVLLTDMTPHPTNTRALLTPVAEKHAKHEPLFGIEQEYTFFKDGRPHGFPPGGFPAPQGFYYCGIGADEVYGRDVVEAHLDACIEAGLGISGINAEV